MISIAADLGGTNFKIALLKDQQILSQMTLPAWSAHGLKARLPVIESAVNEMLNEHDLEPAQIIGMGIAFPGLVDVHTKKIISTNQKYDDARELDLSAWVQSNWQLSLQIDNDARMALRGEWQYGVGKGLDNLVMITLGTGVGGATLINGEILYGKHYQAGCLGGHFTIDYSGRKCTCGNIGCVEAEAAGWSLPEIIKKHPGYPESALRKETTPDFKLLFQQVQAGDKMAVEILDHCLQVWGAGVISMIHAYDPEMVIVSGGIMQSGDLIIPVLQQKVDQMAWTPWGRVEVKQAHYVNEAALLGAHFMVQQLNE